MKPYQQKRMYQYSQEEVVKGIFAPSPTSSWTPASYQEEKKRHEECLDDLDRDVIYSSFF